MRRQRNAAHENVNSTSKCVPTTTVCSTITLETPQPGVGPTTKHRGCGKGGESYRTFVTSLSRTSCPDPTAASYNDYDPNNRL